MALYKTRIYLFASRARGRTEAVTRRPDAKGSQSLSFLALFTRLRRCPPSDFPPCCGLGTSSTYGITSLVPGYTPQRPPSDFSRPLSLCRSPCWSCLQVHLSNTPLDLNRKTLISSLHILSFRPRVPFRYVCMCVRTGIALSSIWVHLGRDIVHHRANARRHRRHEGFY